VTKHDAVGKGVIGVGDAQEGYRSYEKHAWILLFAIGIIGLIASLSAIVIASVPAAADPATLLKDTGMTWDQLVASNPGVAKFISGILRAEVGYFGLGLSILIVITSATTYRKGVKSAWYSLCILPFVYGILAATNFSTGGEHWPYQTLFFGITLLGLLLPIKRFFPRSKVHKLNQG
jgi:hypothetical protein